MGEVLKYTKDNQLTEDDLNVLKVLPLVGQHWWDGWWGDKPASNVWEETIQQIWQPLISNEDQKGIAGFKYWKNDSLKADHKINDSAMAWHRDCDEHLRVTQNVTTSPEYTSILYIEGEEDAGGDLEIILSKEDFNDEDIEGLDKKIIPFKKNKLIIIDPSYVRRVQPMKHNQRRMSFSSSPWESKPSKENFDQNQTTVNIDEWDNLTKTQKEAVTKIEFTGTKKISEVSHRPTMAFATMCKNEEHCIGKTLNAVANYVDYVVVADNGSTDNTFNIVREYFKKTGLPGAWHIDEWYGFDKNKTLMMSYVKDKTDYVIHLDADDFLEGDLKFHHEDIGADLYLVLNKRGTLRYWCSIIYKNTLTWRFIGVAHTIVVAEEKNQPSQKHIPEDMVYIDNAGTGTRALDPKKFLGDALRLSEQYENTLIDDVDGLNSRSAFYCAQSYRDQGGKYNVDALKWYKKYMTLRNTWFEEEYECQLSISDIKIKLNDELPSLGYSFSNEDLENEFLKAISIIPDRAEAYLRLGILYNNSGQFQKAYDILHKGKLISLQKVLDKYVLFIVESNYGLAFNDELSVACYHLNKKKEGIDLIKEVIDHPDSIHSKEHYKSNLTHLYKLK